MDLSDSYAVRVLMLLTYSYCRNPTLITITPSLHVCRCCQPILCALKRLKKQKGRFFLRVIPFRTPMGHKGKCFQIQMHGLQTRERERERVPTFWNALAQHKLKAITALFPKKKNTEKQRKAMRLMESFNALHEIHQSNRKVSYKGRG